MPKYKLWGLFSHLISSVLLVVCFVLPRWLEYVGSGNVSIGLWEMCANGTCESIFSNRSIVIKELGKGKYQ